MTMVQTFSANNNILTQEFQQPNETVNTLIAQTPAGVDAMYYTLIPPLIICGSVFSLMSLVM